MPSSPSAQSPSQKLNPSSSASKPSSIWPSQLLSAWSQLSFTSGFAFSLSSSQSGPPHPASIQPSPSASTLSISSSQLVSRPSQASACSGWISAFVSSQSMRAAMSQVRYPSPSASSPSSIAPSLSLSSLSPQISSAPPGPGQSPPASRSRATERAGMRTGRRVKFRMGGTIPIQAKVEEVSCARGSKSSGAQ